MNDRFLFAPAPRRKSGLILMVAGSLLFHGSLVGLAAFWPTHPPGEPPINITDLGDDPLLAAGPELPAAPPSLPEPEAPALVAFATTEEPPPMLEPEAVSMELATPPPPHPASRTLSSHPAPAAAALHESRAARGLSASSNSAAVDAAGSGRPGVSWKVPKPVYPSALRLAHVQGSGSVRVTTDTTGHVVSAIIVHSTGSLALDDQTCETAKLRWSGPPNATTTVPITYQLQ